MYSTTTQAPVLAPDADAILDRIVELGDCRLAAIQPMAQIELVADCPFAAIGHRGIFSGRGGTGKSTLLYQLLAACSSGNHWLGCAGDMDYHDAPGNALLLSDEPPPRVAQRMSRFEPGTANLRWEAPDVDPNRIRIVPINDVTGPPMLHRMISEWEIDLLIVDPLRRIIMRGADREDYDTVWNGVEAWLPMDLECATIGLHHQHREKEGVKSDSVTKGFGSSAWFDALDLVLDFDRAGDDTTRRIRCGKSRIDGIRHGDEIWLSMDETCTYGYGPADPIQPKGAKLVSPKVVGLPDRVKAHLEKHPKATKASTAAALGLKRGGSTSYKMLCEAFDSFARNRTPEADCTK